MLRAPDAGAGEGREAASSTECPARAAPPPPVAPARALHVVGVPEIGPEEFAGEIGPEEIGPFAEMDVLEVELADILAGPN